MVNTHQLRKVTTALFIAVAMALAMIAALASPAGAQINAAAWWDSEASCAADGTSLIGAGLLNYSGQSMTFKITMSDPGTGEVRHETQEIAGPTGQNTRHELGGIPDGEWVFKVVANGTALPQVLTLDVANADACGADIVSYGQPGCAAAAADGANLTFTITNEGVVARSYNLIAGPHGHSGLNIAAGQTKSFTLQGIPNGQLDLRVERDGQTVGDSSTEIFNCNRTTPAVTMRYETGATDIDGTRMQATWNGDGYYQVRWYYDTTATNIAAANYGGHESQSFVVKPDSNIFPDEPGSTRKFWCVAVRGVLSDGTTTSWRTRCARSFKCASQLVTVITGRGETPTNGADIIWGTGGADIIDARGGNDYVCSLGGNDQVDAGSGSDRIYAGGGNDVVFGGSGNDYLYGSSGNDKLEGNDGTDRLYGQSGEDELVGGNGVDRLYGSNGVDHLYGGDGNDYLYGGNGNDTLLGGYGEDLTNGQNDLDICVSEERRSGCEVLRSGAEHVIALIPHYNLFGTFDDAGRALNRERMEQPLLNLTVAESAEVMDYVRSQNKSVRFVDSMLNVGPSANRNEVVQRWVEAINTELVDYQIETLSYTQFVNDIGCFCYFDGKVNMNYSNVADRYKVLMHETNHSFNDRHGLGSLTAFNEGFSIANGQADGERNIAEAVYGTVLAYRDIGFGPGYPTDLPMGDMSFADAKAADHVATMMAGDVSKIDWFDSAEVQDVYNRFWKPLDRNVDFITEWLPQAELATQQGRNYLGR